MAANGQREPALALVEQGLREIGYTNGLLRRDYPFADFLASSDAVRHVALAAFAQEPPSYRSACFGVLVGGLGTDGSEYRALGAPQLLELTESGLRRWKVIADGAPELLQQLETDEILPAIRAHQSEWGPDTILRAKSIAFDTVPLQLDFFDAGLLPAIESIVHVKLDRLLRETIAASKAVYQEQHLQAPSYPELFRLIFRLLAAKLFADRGQPGEWLQNDPAAVVSAVETFYFATSTPERVLRDPEVQRVAWSKIRSALLLQNISVESLAYVYENTLVDEQVRRRYGTHSTPREIAEYVVRRLPFEDLATDDRRVFEPFAGHGAFLIAALGRLRALLPPGTGSTSRHEYSVRMLAGMEIDSFAREVARLSLMLADYPNPDGWRLLAGDVFNSPALDTEFSRARVVLCNPPFEDFTSDERANYTGSRSENKAADILLRTIEKAPDLLGFVLPRSFVDGQYYREARRTLTRVYSSLELVTLPDSAFRHSGMETVLLIAHGKGRALTHLRSAEVAKKDYDNFIRTAQPTREDTATIGVGASSVSTDPPALWLLPLQRVWRSLDGLPVLADAAEIRNGIYYGLYLRKSPERLIAERPRPGFRPGLVRVSDGFEPLLVRNHVHLNMDSDVMYERSRAHLFAWDKPKVIVNGIRLTRGPWVMTAAPDYAGLVVYHLFHAAWPIGSLSLELLAAILNGPVANAFVSAQRTSRANRIETLNRIPIPNLRAEAVDSISAAVSQYRDLRLRWLAHPDLAATLEQQCRDALLRIDAELLTAYDLPPRVERELLDYFAGHRRPGPVAFDRYYPEGFRPSLPLRMLVSGEVERASASQTLARVPVFRDPIISEMLAELG